MVYIRKTLIFYKNHCHYELKRKDDIQFVLSIKRTSKVKQDFYRQGEDGVVESSNSGINGFVCAFRSKALARARSKSNILTYSHVSAVR